MKREEYKKQVHIILDLVIDIAELNTPDDNHPALSLNISANTDLASVCIIYYKPKKSVKHYIISPREEYNDSDPREVIRELEKIKARLEKEKDPQSCSSKGSIN